MINYLKSFLYTLGIILVCLIFLTILNYFNILNGITLKVFEYVVPFIAIIIGSFLLGKKSSRKGYIEGLKFGSIWLLIYLFINLILKTINLSSIIYFILIIIFSMLGGMFGINKKNN